MTNIIPIDPEEPYDWKALTRALDQAKAKVFMGSRAAFLGSLVASAKYVWTKSVQTAATDGEYIFWNPDDFMNCSEQSRHSTLVHELWHIARLHVARGESKDPKVWNMAIDYKVNLDCKDEGYIFTAETPVLLDEKYRGMLEEDIYNLLMQNPPPPSSNALNGAMGDLMITATPGTKITNANNVMVAVQQAIMAGQAGTVPGDVKQLLTDFLKPIINWDVVLHRWFKNLLTVKRTWRRPNRRYLAHGTYLPTTYKDKGKLEHVVFFEDVSGSITDEQARRFNSEVSHIWKTYRPNKLTIVQFDTKIQKVDILEDGDQFYEIEIHGRGGTCLRCVRQWIIENEPTAVVIFSDMWVAPMELLPKPVPLIYVAISNRHAEVLEGQIIHIDG